MKNIWTDLANDDILHVTGIHCIYELCISAEDWKRLFDINQDHSYQSAGVPFIDG